MAGCWCLLHEMPQLYCLAPDKLDRVVKKFIERSWLQNIYYLEEAGMKKRILLTVLVVTAMTVSGAFAVEQFETVKKTETLTSSSTSVVTSEMKQTTAYQDLSAQDAKVLIDNHENVVIIDVSTRYAEGHVPHQGDEGGRVAAVQIGCVFICHCIAGAVPISRLDQIAQSGQGVEQHLCSPFVACTLLCDCSSSKAVAVAQDDCTDIQLGQGGEHTCLHVTGHFIPEPFKGRYGHGKILLSRS